VNIRMGKAFTGKTVWVLEDNTGSWMLTEAEARELHAEFTAAFGDDVKADLLEACLAVVDHAIIQDNEPGCWLCIICGETSELREMAHESGCPVGMAWQAAARAKGAE